jgi:hypothetical protein
MSKRPSENLINKKIRQSDGGENEAYHRIISAAGNWVLSRRHRKG